MTDTALCAALLIAAATASRRQRGGMLDDSVNPGVESMETSREPEGTEAVSHEGSRDPCDAKPLFYNIDQIYFNKEKSEVYRVDYKGIPYAVKLVKSQSDWENEVEAGLPMDDDKQFQTDAGIAFVPTENEVGAGLPMDDDKKFQTDAGIAFAPTVDPGVRGDLICIVERLPNSFGKKQEKHAIVTPYWGDNLYKWIVEDGGKDPSRRQQMSKAVASLFVELFNSKATHGDIKPLNVLVDGKTVRLIDWETYKTKGTSSPFAVHGTLGWMCPEMLQMCQEALSGTKPTNAEYVWAVRQLNDAFAGCMTLYAVQHRRMARIESMDALLGKKTKEGDTSADIIAAKTSEAISIVTQIRDEGYQFEDLSQREEKYNVLLVAGEIVQLYREDPYALLAVKAVQLQSGSLKNGDTVTIVRCDNMDMWLRKPGLEVRCHYVTPPWNAMLEQPEKPPPPPSKSRPSNTQTERGLAPKKLDFSSRT